LDEFVFDFGYFGHAEAIGTGSFAIRGHLHRFWSRIVRTVSGCRYPLEVNQQSILKDSCVLNLILQSISPVETSIQL
jgi:hypothetical protein